MTNKPIRFGELPRPAQKFLRGFDIAFNFTMYAVDAAMTDGITLLAAGLGVCAAATGGLLTIESIYEIVKTPAHSLSHHPILFGAASLLLSGMGAGLAKECIGDLAKIPARFREWRAKPLTLMQIT